MRLASAALRAVAPLPVDRTREDAAHISTTRMFSASQTFGTASASSPDDE